MSISKSVVCCGLIILALSLAHTSANAQTAAQSELQSATLFSNLPENCATPDAFDIAPNGTLTLSCPNFANRKLQGELLTLNESGIVKPLATVPTLQFKNKANPMGIAYGPNGELYIADARGPKNGRILMLQFDGTRLISTEVVASGFNPNGLRYHQGYLYATQMNFSKIKSKTPTSGIYQFKATDRNIKLTNTKTDKQLIFTVESISNKPGIDGIAFDSKGYLYAGHFNDGIIFKFGFDSEQQIIQQEIFKKVAASAGIDGLAFDQYDNLYLAGFSQNQILKIDQDKKVSIIAEYADNNGSNGQLDQPADLIVYNDKLIISNFDLMVQKGMKNTKHSKPYTISSINLATNK